MIVCAARLKALLRTSLISRANMMGAGKFEYERIKANDDRIFQDAPEIVAAKKIVEMLEADPVAAHIPFIGE